MIGYSNRQKEISCGGYESRLFLRELLAAARKKRGVSEATYKLFECL